MLAAQAVGTSGAAGERTKRTRQLKGASDVTFTDAWARGVAGTRCIAVHAGQLRSHGPCTLSWPACTTTHLVPVNREETAWFAYSRMQCASTCTRFA